MTAPSSFAQGCERVHHPQRSSSWLGQPVHVHRLPLREKLAGCLALLARAARAFLHAPEWHVELDTGALLIDFDDPGVDVVCKAHGACQVIGEYTGGQAVARV